MNCRPYLHERHSVETINSAGKKINWLSIERIGSSIRVLTVHIPSFLNDFLSTGRTKRADMFLNSDAGRYLLSESESETLARFKTEKRQVQWIAGRFAVKILAGPLFPPSCKPSEIEIAYTGSGAPYLPALPEICISISHSHDYAAGLVCHEPGMSAGIDIEKHPLENAETVLRYAFSEAEYRTLKCAPSAETTRYWTKKEAFLKCMKKGLHEDPRKIEVSGDTIVFRGKVLDRVRVKTIDIDRNYILSTVFNS